ncbi:serine/threonine protein kinase [Archangium sp.]|uniref:serine/threonine protein kinase n=1 Tax=Archangium sp. TaxID=1872627 RepID=UPI003899CAFC
MHDEMGGAGEGPWLELEPGERVAGFILEGKISSGSGGTVYRASRDGRAFAVKLVPVGRRGQREVDALRRVQSPHVVSFRGYSLWPDEEPRFLVLALALVEGRPLDVWAREQNPSVLELVRQVLLPLARTLGEVHAAGVVHRDVKEPNVVMREADGLPVLVDFGAAAYEGAPRLTTLLPPGTPEYRSPEAYRFAREWEGGPYPFGKGDDLWALGVAMYGLLTRELPFGDRHDLDMVRSILQEDPEAPHLLNPRVPPALGALCLRLLAKAPEARFPDARALEAALEDAAARADDAWAVPLFPGGRRERRPVPALEAEGAPAPVLVSEVAPVAAPVVAPALAERARPGGGWWPWAAGFVLGAAVVAGVLLFLPRAGRRAPEEQVPAARVASATPRITSPTPSQPQQAVPRQEMAPPRVTGDVGPGAVPRASPTPAPVARATRSEDTAMKKSQTARSLLTVGCLAGSACASGPHQRPPPPEEECPPGSIEFAKQAGILAEENLVVFPSFESTRVAIVREGEVSVELAMDWRELPAGTVFTGRTMFGTDRVYGRFTRARLPGGETVPVCMAWLSTDGLGIKMEPGSTAREARLPYAVYIRAVPYFFQ